MSCVANGIRHVRDAYMKSMESALGAFVEGDWYDIREAVYHADGSGGETEACQFIGFVVHDEFRSRAYAVGYSMQLLDLSLVFEVGGERREIVWEEVVDPDENQAMPMRITRREGPYAAQNGHLEVLQWAHANGCPWDKWACSYAAQNGHLEV